MDNIKTPEALDCSYASLCCYSPVIPFTGFGVLGVTWTGAASAAAAATETLDASIFPPYSNSVELFTNRRIEKSHWICDYSDDIFQTLRETELRRNVLSFQSEQCGFRPVMLRLLKVATEVHQLSRTTLHLALYLLDGFMDNYTIRTEKLNLTAMTCLIVAAKIEEADINAPKFAELNKLVGDVYTLDDFRKAEMKVLMLFHFDLIRPTTATFAEYFANNIITLDDFHLYLQNWHGGMSDFRTILQHQQLNDATPDIVPPYYRTYEEMATVLSKLLFNLVDETLCYIKFVNARPSIIAASCIAAVRHLSFVTPLWTPYLVSVTECTQDMIEPCMEAIIALHNLHISKVQAMLYAAAKLSNAGATLCDSPESGFVSISDMKSESSENESDLGECKFPQTECTVVLGKRSRSAAFSDESDDGQENTSCLSPNFPLLGKRRRMLENDDGVI
ncbi:PREDICTED: cyclin-J isoform X2 [Rhagoletis zephyria]|uniref:cyclin-J isoform X2 n=1 Tax=Rhagoletis zephyria TaxID=28612 RepID=UPI00081147B7|nr:PREDICTED: cyclin-J isoform X2 [Rhagoletis zephyria]